MKIAIPMQGNDLNSAMDPRFGRAAYFAVADTDSGEIKYSDNAQNLNAVQGAGIQAAQTAAALEVEAVVSSNVGPKAWRTLQAAGIKVFLCSAGTAPDVLKRFKAGELKEMDGANVDGHWG